MLGPPPSDSGYPQEPQFEVPPPEAFERIQVPPEPITPASNPFPERRRAGEHHRARSRGFIGLVAALATLSLALVVFFSIPPQDMVAYWPQSAGVYNALGIQVNKSGFKIIATQTQELANSIPIIVIKGELINETDRELEVPPVRIAVRDRGKKELHHWIVRAEQDHVGPRGKGSFSARLESPPADAVDLEVRFAREGER